MENCSRRTPNPQVARRVDLPGGGISVHRKLVGTLASVAMLAGLLFIGATPAQAAPPTTVRLVFGDHNTNCVTGPTFKENVVGDFDSLLACVFDGAGNKKSTTDADGGSLTWGPGPGDNNTTVTGPSETDGVNVGEALGLVSADSPGADNPTVCLFNQAGDQVMCDSVEKNVLRAPRSAVTIHHRKAPHRFKGRVTSLDAGCVPDRQVRIKRRRPGADLNIGSDLTDAAGKYVVPHTRTRRTRGYYARVTATADCLSDRSRTIRVR